MGIKIFYFNCLLDYLYLIMRKNVIMVFVVDYEFKIVLRVKGVF